MQRDYSVYLNDILRSIVLLGYCADKTARFEVDYSEYI
jgi:hypothetical protein